ncbi:hypothetical protein Tco_0280797 [Tanacetum coccineum]
MSTPTFAATHNLVAFLEKPAESNGFEQIIDFLNAKPIKFALTESIRSDIHFDDAEGTVYLPNDVIFEELAKIGAKTTAWNKFSSTMASAIICLANNQKFNFSMYILDNMVKNLEGGVKFFMFPRFLQVFLNKQVDGMNKHKETFVISSHTKKVFANMRRQSDEFSRVVTPLFDNMLIQASKEIGEDLGHPTNSTQIPIDDQPSTYSTPKKKQKSRRRQRKEVEVSQDDPRHEESEPTPSNDPQPSGKGDCHFKYKSQEARKEEKVKTYRIQKVKEAKINQDENVNLIDEAQEQLNDEEMFRVNDLHGKEVTVEDTTTKVIITTVSTLPVTTVEVVTTVSAPTTNIEELTLTQTLIEIKAAKPKTIKAVTTDATLVTTVATIVFITIVTRLSTKGIVFHDQEEQENKQAVMEADRLLAKRLQTRESEKRGLTIGIKVKVKQKVDEQIETEKVDDLKDEEMKKHIEVVREGIIVIDAVPLANKPPTIVDYKIIKAGIIGHFQLIREDGSSKRYSSVIKMLQGIDREDLRILWKLVKTKHGDIGPEDEYERVLWGDLKVMFEPDIMSDV